MLNNNGLCTHPWGTGLAWETDFCVTLCFLRLRKWCVQLARSPLIPCNLTFQSNLSCRTLLKALFTALPSSILLVTFSKGSSFVIFKRLQMRFPTHKAMLTNHNQPLPIQNAGRCYPSESPPVTYILLMSGSSPCNSLALLVALLKKTGQHWPSSSLVVIHLWVKMWMLPQYFP